MSNSAVNNFSSPFAAEDRSALTHSHIAGEPASDEGLSRARTAIQDATETREADRSMTLRTLPNDVTSLVNITNRTNVENMDGTCTPGAQLSSVAIHEATGVVDEDEKYKYIRHTSIAHLCEILELSPLPEGASEGAEETYPTSEEIRKLIDSPGPMNTPRQPPTPVQLFDSPDSVANESLNN